MIFITFNSKLHHFDSFWTFKTQNTIYNYIYLENYKYKNLKEAVEIYKNQIKTMALNSLFPLLSIMECYKPNR